jgi:hypothetical protein
LFLAPFLPLPGTADTFLGWPEHYPFRPFGVLEPVFFLAWITPASQPWPLIAAPFPHLSLFAGSFV